MSVVENNFSQDDTLEQRVLKLNQQCGLSYRLKDLGFEVSGQQQYCLMSIDGERHETGLMDSETLMQWMATFALGYRTRSEHEALINA